MIRITMGKKLTLSIDEKLIKAAKLHATKTGQSLSAMVETFFRAMTEKRKAPKLTGIVGELAGVASKLNQCTDEELKQEYREHLEKKYS